MLKSSKKGHKHEDLKKVPQLQKDKKVRLNEIRERESEEDMDFEFDDLSDTEDEEC